MTRRPVRVAVPLIATLVVLLGVAPGFGFVFEVTDPTDAIPAIPGTLRWAIEKSNANAEPDQILLYAIEGQTIELVAPLPDLTEGKLTIGELPEGAWIDPVHPARGVVQIHGGGIIPSAFAIRSPANVVTGVQFSGFAGPEVVLVEAGRGRRALFVDCLFGGDTPIDENLGVAIRIVPGAGPAGDVGTMEIWISRFARNEGALSLDGDPAAGPIMVRLIRNWIGTSADGGPGPGNQFAVAASFGNIFMTENRVGGPGRGIDLGRGTAGSVVSSNEIGLLSQRDGSCAGFGSAAVRVDDAVRVERNAIRCSDVAVHVDTAGAGSRVTGNRIGGAGVLGMATDGIRFAATSDVKIDRNVITGSGGFGIARDPASPGTPDPGPLVVCNEATNSGAGAFQLLTSVPPPELLGATPLIVDGQLTGPLAGWVEIFSDEAEQAGIFHGALPAQDVAVTFQHELPVVRLTVRPAAPGDGHVIAFDRSLVGTHVATAVDGGLGETSDPSFPLPADNTGLAFDVVRGDVGKLGPDPAGGVALGDLFCLAASLPPGGPDVVDADLPAPGAAFFYLARRRIEAVDQHGTYDPALCADVVGKGFRGPRRPGIGDCAP